MPGCDVSLSSEILPQIREYYRLSTTVINAYLQPILARYVANLDRRLAAAGVATRQKYIMQSNGGMSTFAPGGAHRRSPRCCPGPAGGVTAGVAVEPQTRHRQHHHLRHGRHLLRRGADQGRRAGRFRAAARSRAAIIAVPMMDINTVSAGGGTIAKVDRFGVLEVGPHSAGAVPGPACYGRGGETATITDCNLVLGYLSADNFLGGRMQLDRAKRGAAVARVAEAAVARYRSTAAEGIVRIIDVKMEEAIKAISTMRGHDLRDFMLLAFGGAGPLHAARMARDLGMAGVIVPLYPGVFSAIGLADVRRQARLHSLAHDADRRAQAATTWRRCSRELEAQARDDLRRDGFATATSGSIARSTCATPGRATRSRCRATARARPRRSPACARQFDDEHQSQFGHMAPDEPVEVVSYRVRGIGLVPRRDHAEIRAGRARRSPMRCARRGRCASTARRFRARSISARSSMSGSRLRGPAILDQFDCTTVICAGQVARVDRVEESDRDRG